MAPRRFKPLSRKMSPKSLGIRRLSKRRAANLAVIFSVPAQAEQVHPSNFLLSQIGRFQEGIVQCHLLVRQGTDVNIFLVCPKLTQISMILVSRPPPLLLLTQVASFVYRVRIQCIGQYTNLPPLAGKTVLYSQQYGYAPPPYTHFSNLDFLHTYVGSTGEISSSADISQLAALKLRS